MKERLEQQIAKIRNEFPMLDSHQTPLIYFDNAATTQKPKEVISKTEEYYSRENANIHRGAYRLSENASAQYEAVREKVANFIGAGDPSEIIFTRGTTESLNFVARAVETFGRIEGPIVVTRMEHHSNFVPWQQLALRQKLPFQIVDITEQGQIDLASLEKSLSGSPRVFAFAWMSNTLGSINQVRELSAMAQKKGAWVVVDAAQGVAHRRFNLQEEKNIDFLAFSAHKMFGPTGLGVLWGRKSLLEKIPPDQFGGGMVLKVEDHQTTWNEIPWRFEAGTPNIGAVIAFGKSIDFINRVGLDFIQEYETQLTRYALEKLEKTSGVKTLGPRSSEERAPVISFLVAGIHPHDLATFLDSEGIAVRAGHHCAQPLMNRLGIGATTRMSFSIYNTFEEVDRCVAAIGRAQKYFKVETHE